MIRRVGTVAATVVVGAVLVAGLVAIAIRTSVSEAIVIGLVSGVLGSAATAVATLLAVRWTMEGQRQLERDARVAEQRGQLYVDLLTEAYAEQRFFDYETADDETRERVKKYFVDLRLPEMERARLGARANAFASTKVKVAFGQLQGHALATFLAPITEATRVTGRMRVADALAALEHAIRRDLGTDSTQT